MECREVLELLSPYLDDELDAVTGREIARHVASCEGCAAALARQREVGETLRLGLEYHRAPDLLRARVARQMRGSARGGAWRGLSRPWRWVGAAAAIAVVAGSAWIAMGARDRRADALASEAVGNHIRSLMAAHLTDVSSTDQHTVKPWFAGKLDFSPPVTDLASSGFPLIGGRLEYLAGRSVAALVYQHRKHIINVFAWPVMNEAEGVAAPVTKQGYHCIRATHDHMAMIVVSDLNAQELTAFVRMLAAPGPM